MNIAILTQSISANYGCNLQAFALQTVIKRLGHNVFIIDRWGKNAKATCAERIKTWVIDFIKTTIKICIFKPVYLAIKENERGYFWKNIICFQKRYLNKSERIYSTEGILLYVKMLGIDCFIVGSDQVWRPRYNINGMLENMFLDFSEEMNVKRIAYAASFGVDKWEFSDEQTNTCSRLVKKFDKVSVREMSGIQLCNKFFGVHAELVLDPTLLLGTKDYNILIEHSNTTAPQGGLFCYILDSSAEAKQAIRYFEQKTKLSSYTCLPLVPEGGYRLMHKKEAVLPSPEQWLRSFRDAQMVFVDSFHGAVFSIIYNKPFWVLGNKKRGMARFDSLLSLFGLQHRLITIDEIGRIDIFSPIQWECVNAKMKGLQAKSEQYLKEALGMSC